MLKIELKDGEQKVFFKSGGEWCYLWTPPGYNQDKSVPLVIHHHGARGYVREGEADWIVTPSKKAFLDAVMRGGGCAIAGSHACGDHWGNECAVEANAALLEVLEDTKGIDTDRLGLMGGGLGGALIWNSVLGPMKRKVKAVAVMQAVANLSDIIRAGKFKEPCLKAYDIPPDTPDEEAIEKIKSSDPMNKLQDLKPGVELPKTAIYHGAKDENVPAQNHAIPLAEALGNAGSDVNLEIFQSVEHNVYAMGEHMEKRLEDFFKALKK